LFYALKSQIAPVRLLIPTALTHAKSIKTSSHSKQINSLKSSCRHGKIILGFNAKMAVENANSPYHAKYYAHLLDRSAAANSVEKIIATLQIEAAIFAFRSPFQMALSREMKLGLEKR
jgi:hypothetical protein